MKNEKNCSLNVALFFCASHKTIQGQSRYDCFYFIKTPKFQSVAQRQTPTERIVFCGERRNLQRRRPKCKESLKSITFNYRPIIVVKLPVLRMIPPLKYADYRQF
ncbi:unnamed protein product [Albugo candida]|uniref:Uncharacterized protein n=1 Tax=Albugo candida TaxID=65357 RepID=A0A024GH45_9STRA|nr:unnamed protein product [Albugo candida]|eukprot:CCI46005.1 unnamed protein product [Albugo candida]